MHYPQLIKLLLEQKVLYLFLQIFQPGALELVMTEVEEHIIMRLISKLINGISRVFHKVLKYFNGSIISMSFVLPSAGVFSVFFLFEIEMIQNLLSYHLANRYN